jgi:hypothetical protein
MINAFIDKHEIPEFYDKRLNKHPKEKEKRKYYKRSKDIKDKDQYTMSKYVPNVLNIKYRVEAATKKELKKAGETDVHLEVMVAGADNKLLSELLKRQKAAKYRFVDVSESHQKKFDAIEALQNRFWFKETQIQKLREDIKKARDVGACKMRAPFAPKKVQPSQGPGPDSKEFMAKRLQ